MAEEEQDIDVEALQAQIDLSMSVANNLVSSWIKPSTKSKSSTSQHLEAELKEYMRRPPRLGVGATIPESSSVSSREMARLKGQLVGKGKKRSRQDEGEASIRQLSDDERESRTGAIRKKPLPNPFSIPAPKKKKVDDTAPAKNNLLGNVELASTSEESRKNEKIPPLDVLGGEQKTDIPPSPELRHGKAPSKLVHSVLNLNGPVGEEKSNSDDDKDVAASPSKHKKKRKRRKKKKAPQVAGTNGGSVQMSKPDS